MYEGQEIEVTGKVLGKNPDSSTLVVHFNEIAISRHVSCLDIPNKLLSGFDQDALRGREASVKLVFTGGELEMKTLEVLP